MMMEEGSRRKIENLSQRKFSDGVNELALHQKISVENFFVSTEERRDGSYSQWLCNYDDGMGENQWRRAPFLG